MIFFVKWHKMGISNNTGHIKMRRKQFCQPWNSAKTHFHVVFQKILQEILKFQSQFWGWSRGTKELQCITFSPEVNEFLCAKGFMKIKPLVLANTCPNQMVSSSVLQRSPIIIVGYNQSFLFVSNNYNNSTVLHFFHGHDIAKFMEYTSCSKREF